MLACCNFAGHFRDSRCWHCTGPSMQTCHWNFGKLPVDADAHPRRLLRTACCIYPTLYRCRRKQGTPSWHSHEIPSMSQGTIYHRLSRPPARHASTAVCHRRTSLSRNRWRSMQTSCSPQGHLPVSAPVSVRVSAPELVAPNMPSALSGHPCKTMHCPECYLRCNRYSLSCQTDPGISQRRTLCKTTCQPK